MKNIFQKRLENSEYSNFSGDVIISTYTKGYKLSFKDTELINILELTRNGLGKFSIRLPPEMLSQLLLGYHSIDKMKAYETDVLVNPSQRHLLDLLFPEIRPVISF